MSASDHTLQISDQHSVFFDFFRLYATLAVVIQHATGDPNLAPEKISLLGRAVIPFFLILSGYMTAITVRRNAPLVDQLIRRYLKYYYVVIIAVVFSYLTNVHFVSVDSVILERAKFEPATGYTVILREIFEAFTYSGEYWRMTTHSQGLFGNEAFWTMDYIIAYVVATMVVYLASGVCRWVLLLLVAFIAGPTVLLLSPLWFAGVLAYEFHKRAAAGKIITPNRLAANALIVVGAALVLIAELTSLGDISYEFSKTFVEYDIREHMGMSKRYLWQWIDTLGVFLIVVGSKYVLSDKPAPRTKATMRTLSTYTLPVYLLHFNAIYLAQTFIPNYDPTRYGGGLLPMLFIAFTLTVALSWVSIRWLEPVNRSLTNHFMNTKVAS